MRGAVAILILLMLLAPVAGAASDMRLEVTPLEGPQPLLRNITVPARVVVPCALLQNGTASGAVALLDAPGWLTLDANTTGFDVGLCGDDPQVATLNLTVRISADAPALGAANARLVAVLLGETAVASFPITADVFTLLDVSADSTVQEGGPQSVLTFPIHLRNFGNAITRVSVEVGPAPPGWVVIAPQPATLQSRQGGGLVTDGTVKVIVQTPHRFGMMNEVVSIPVWVNATPALGAGKVEQTNVTLVATAKGFDTPGPALPVVAGALLLVALVLRRRA